MRPPRAYGLFDDLAFSVNYNFTRSEFAAALEEGDPSSEVIKTIQHETMHLYQLASTPYGFYYGALKNLQSKLVLNLIRALSECGAPVRVPLGAYVELLPRSDPGLAQARRQLEHWRFAEAMLLYLEGDPEMFYQQFASTSFGESITPLLLFETVDTLLGSDATSEEAPSLNDFSPNDLQHAEMLFALRASAEYDLRAVLESGATAAEYWNTPVPLPDFSTKIHDNYSMQRFHLLGMAAGMRSWSNPSELLLSFAALSEIALCSPLPAHLRSMRGEHMTLLDLDPVSRILEAVLTLENVDPVRSLEDYGRFQEDVCALHSWPTPVALSRASLDHPPPTTPLSIEPLYGIAQAHRVQNPAAFADLDVRWASTPEAQEFTGQFIHPIIEFKDAFYLHKNRSFAERGLATRLVDGYMRQLFLTGETTVRAPCPLEPETAASYAELIKEMLVEAGLNRPQVQVLGGSAREALALLGSES
jgi:hypothetical protein